MSLMSPDWSSSSTISLLSTVASAALPSSSSTTPISSSGGSAGTRWSRSTVSGRSYSSPTTCAVPDSCIAGNSPRTEK